MEVTHCGGMGAHFKKCWITTQSIAHIGQPNVITTRKVGYGRANMTCCL